MNSELIAKLKGIVAEMETAATKSSDEIVTSTFSKGVDGTIQRTKLNL